jgi:hypothetical protein
MLKRKSNIKERKKALLKKSFIVKGKKENCVYRARKIEKGNITIWQSEKGKKLPYSNKIKACKCLITKDKKSIVQKKSLCGKKSAYLVTLKNKGKARAS